MDSITSDRSAAEHPAPRTPLTDALLQDMVPEAESWAITDLARRMEADRAELRDLLDELAELVDPRVETDWAEGEIIPRVRAALKKVKP